MSEWNGEIDQGDQGHDEQGLVSYDGSNESHDLTEGHQAAGSEHSHLSHLSQSGQEHHYERDEHFANTRHIEYDDGHGGHYEVTEYTEYDSHVEESDSSFGTSYTEADNSSQFSELEYLAEHFRGGELTEFGSGNDNGEAALSSN